MGFAILNGRSGCLTGEMLNGTETGEALLKAGGVDFTWAHVPCIVQGPNGNVPARTQGVIRTDTGEVVGEVGPSTVLIQPLEAIAIHDALVGSGRVASFSCGTLADGAGLFWIGKLNEGWSIRRDGQQRGFEGYFSGSLRIDNAASLRLGPAMTDPICQNTLAANLREASEFRVIKRAGWKDAYLKAAEVVDRMVEGMGATAAEFQRLAEAPMTGAEFRGFAEEWLGGVPDAKVHPRSAASYDRTLGELAGLFRDGTGNQGQNRFDAFSAVTEWLDHKRSASRKAMDALRCFQRTMFEPESEARRQRARALLIRGR